MRNVTISLDEKLAKLTRIEAAKAGKSMSRFISEIVEAAVRSQSTSEDMRNAQLKAMQRFLAGAKIRISESGRMPTAEERNARD